MYNLIQLYLNNNIHGVSMDTIMNQIEQHPQDEYYTNGFWIGTEYYSCIKQLFSLRNQKVVIKKNTKCTQVIATLLNENISLDKCNCYKCLKHCLENMRSGQATLKIE